MLKKWIQVLAAALLLWGASIPAKVFAQTERTLADESMYDLLIDRYFNGNQANDFNVDVKNPAAYAGGDFAGLLAKKDYIQQMGFTLVSIGTIFDADDYTGTYIKSYDRFEEHFGTEEEFQQVLAAYEKAQLGIVIDFPLNRAHASHDWASTSPTWIKQQEPFIQWDTANVDWQQAVKQQLATFLMNYSVAGIRLTALEGVSTPFINELITLAKEKQPTIYIMSNEESDANFDARYMKAIAQQMTAALSNVDQSTATLTSYIEENEKPLQLLFDELHSDRFTYATTSHAMYPPTRMKIALATTLLMPGFPVIQYGSEIVMNGRAKQDAHQIYNFKTDNEIVTYIQSLNRLRNESRTLRAGETSLLLNDNGHLVWQQRSDEEQWIVAINNTSGTKTVAIDEDVIGEDQELRGMFENDIIRVNKDKQYAIIQDREYIEIYQVIENKGINVSYLFTLAAVFIGYTVFILLMMKRGKRKRNNS